MGSTKFWFRIFVIQLSASLVVDIMFVIHVLKG